MGGRVSGLLWISGGGTEEGFVMTKLRLAFDWLLWGHLWESSRRDSFLRDQKGACWLAGTFPSWQCLCRVNALFCKWVSIGKFTLKHGVHYFPWVLMGAWVPSAIQCLHNPLCINPDLLCLFCVNRVVQTWDSDPSDFLVFLLNRLLNSFNLASVTVSFLFAVNTALLHLNLALWDWNYFKASSLLFSISTQTSLLQLNRSLSLLCIIAWSSSYKSMIKVLQIKQSQIVRIIFCLLCMGKIQKASCY